MRNAIIAIVLLAVVGAAAAYFILKPKQAEALKYVQDNAFLVGVIQNLEEPLKITGMIEEMNSEELKLSGTAKDLAGDLFEEIEEATGLKLDAPKTYKDSYIDVVAPITFSSHFVGKDDIVFMMYFQTRDAEKAVAFIKETIDEIDADIDLDVSQQNNVDIHEVGDHVAFCTQGSTLILAASDSDRSAKNMLERLADQDYTAITENENFMSRSALFAEYNSMIYFDITDSKINKALKEQLKYSELGILFQVVDDDHLDAVEGAVAYWKISDAEADYGMTVFLEEGNEFITAYKETNSESEYFGELHGKPIVTMKFSIDIEKALDGLEKDARKAWREGAKEIKSEFGVDVKDDVIPFIGSPISVALLREQSEDLPVGGVFWVPLKKDHKMDEVVKDLVETLEEDMGMDIDSDTKDGLLWYSIEAPDGEMKAAFAVKDKYLVVYAGQDVVEAGMDASGKSLKEHLPSSMMDIMQSSNISSSVSVSMKEVAELLEDQMDEDNMGSGRSALEQKIVAEAMQGIMDDLSSVNFTAGFRESPDGVDFNFSVANGKDGFGKTFKDSILPALQDYDETILEWDRREEKARENIDAIGSALSDYVRINNDLPEIGWCPSDKPKEKTSWDDCSALSDIGFEGTGKTNCTYKVMPTFRENVKSKCDNSCRYAYDGTCDEPRYCRDGTDCNDCGASEVYSPGSRMFKGYEMQVKCAMPKDTIVGYTYSSDYRYAMPSNPEYFE